MSWCRHSLLIGRIGVTTGGQGKAAERACTKGVCSRCVWLKMAAVVLEKALVLIGLWIGDNTGLMIPLRCEWRSFAVWND